MKDTIKSLLSSKFVVRKSTEYGEPRRPLEVAKFHLRDHMCGHRENNGSSNYEYLESKCSIL